MTKKIFKSIGLIAFAIAVAIASFFVPMQKRGTSHLASANETSTNYTFRGSNIYVSLWRDSMASGYYYTDNGIYQNTFYLRGNSLVVDITDSFVYLEAHDGSGDRYNYAFHPLNFSSSYIPTSETIINIPLSSSGSYYHTYLVASNHSSTVYASYDIFYYISSSSFNCNVYKVEFNSSAYNIPNYGEYFFNTLTYYDNNDNYVSVLFKNLDPYNGDGTFNYRSYLLSNSLTDNQIYNQGYNDGLSDNQSTVYDNGYTSGYDDGFENGKITGVAEANDYSFFSLFGAIFDAPVTMFTSLLNFNFLGINLWAFVTSLLTLSAILFVIKLFIRR